ncbi:MAG: hypothetical protein K9J17_12275 [Flavobacteriales bacterium]|nr:hypothetical protein [Flavobacteriales bacterium]
MKKIGTYAVLLTLFVGCRNFDSTNDDQLNFIIHRAKSLDDYNTAIQATYKLMSADTNELMYYDSLATYYLKAGEYGSALATSKYLLKFRNTEKTLEVGMTSAILLNKLNDVVLFGEILITERVESPKWSYELAKAYYNLGRDSDARSELLRLIALPGSKVEFTSMNISNKTYDIPYYAAAQNLLGVLYANEGKLEDCKYHLLEAIRFSPEFPLPQQNLSILTKK